MPIPESAEPTVARRVVGGKRPTAIPYQVGAERLRGLIAGRTRTIGRDQDARASRFHHAERLVLQKVMHRLLQGQTATVSIASSQPRGNVIA